MIFTQRNASKDLSTILFKITILGIVVTAIVYSFSQGISGNDFWWHFKIGEWVIENKAIPTTDIFSWLGSQQEILWTAHEWLADVLLYLIHATFGDVGIYVFSLSAAFFMTGLLWREARQYVEQNLVITGLFFVLFAITSYGFFYGRPHIFSFFLVYWQLKLLFRFYRDPTYKGIYWLPVLTCLWSNLHGGYASLSYILCAVFLVAGALNIQVGKIKADALDKRALAKLLAVTLCSVGAILVNPVSLEVLLYPYKSFGDQLQMTFINEWQPPDAKNLFDLFCFFLPIILMMIGFFAEQKRIRFLDLAVMGLFVFLFLRSVRFIMVWYIAAVFCAFPYIPQLKLKPMCPVLARSLIAVFLLVFGILIGDGSMKAVKTIQQGETISVTLTDEVISAIKETDPKRIFNDYNYGEALIYHEIPVFFDARADLYVDNNVLADGLSLMDLTQADVNENTPYVDVDMMISKYGFDYILIQKDRALYSYLISHPEAFERVYENDSVGYFKVHS